MSKSEYTNEDVRHEEGIVWLVDAAMLEYVRHDLATVPYHMRSKYGRPRAFAMVLRRVERQLPGEMVGYSFSDQSNRFRVFWLKPHDRYFDPEGTYHYGAPVEAIAAQTIAPGVNGHMTNRTWEGSERKRCEVRREKEYPIISPGNWRSTRRKTIANARGRPYLLLMW